MIRKIFGLILLILVGSILAISFIFGEGKSQYYWFTVAWVIFLMFLNWATSIVVIEPKNLRRGAPGSWVAIFPALSIATFFYSLLSIFLICLWWINILNGQFLFTLQIIIFAIFSVTALITIAARYFQARGSASVLSKEDFVEKLNKIKSVRADDNDLKAIKEMHDYVKYTMQHPAKLDQDMIQSAFNMIKVFDESNPSVEEISKALMILKSS
tara:strand:- start:86 stop:724 length:639 start_codon:yes stop_codon:yes gene_type:complete